MTGRCSMCGHPLPPRSLWARLTRPPHCADVEACFRRYRVRMGWT